jgi:hypothetical protein
MRTLIYSLILSLGLFSLEAAKLDPIEKKVKLQYDLNRNAQIDIDASNTDLKIEVWDQAKVEIEVAFRFRGKEHREKIEEFLKDFDAKVKEGISVSPESMRLQTYRTLPKKVNIGWEDFSIVQYTFSREEVQLQYYIKMPAQGQVNIRHSYRDLRVIGTLFKLNLEQYSGRFAADQINEGDLSMKYGEANIRRFLAGKIYLYENELSGNQFGKLNLNAKYSQLRINEIDGLEFTAYESEAQFQKVVSLSGNLKYSDLRCNQMNALAVTSYESRYNINTLKSAQLKNSKYSRYEMDLVQTITVGQAYEDQMRIRKVQSFDAGNSKYCEHRIQDLEKDYSLQGYECELQIEKLSGPGGTISINGKYLKAEIHTEEAVIELQASLQYGDLDYPEEQYTANVMKNGSNTSANLKSKASKAGQAYSILVNGYETNIRLY